MAVERLEHVLHDRIARREKTHGVEYGRRSRDEPSHVVGDRRDALALIEELRLGARADDIWSRPATRSCASFGTISRWPSSRSLSSLRLTSFGRKSATRKPTSWTSFFVQVLPEPAHDVGQKAQLAAPLPSRGRGSLNFLDIDRVSIASRRF